MTEVIQCDNIVDRTFYFRKYTLTFYDSFILRTAVKQKNINYEQLIIFCIEMCSYLKMYKNIEK